MSHDLALALASAYQEAEPEGRVTAIKMAISRQLESTDRGARIRHTEYFNNSIAPDLVLQWPKENRERLVFLRANPSPEWLATDLEAISSTQPLVIALNAAFSKRSSTEYQEVQTLAAESDTLIADPLAVDELGEPYDEEPAAGLMAQAMLRGGRGILGAETTRSAITQTIDGFHGAEQVNLSETRQATDLLARILQPEQASRLGRVLQSVWEGHGGRAADFPGYRELSGRMTDGDLEFLLTNVPTQSIDFWRKIGRGVEVSQIARLDLPNGSPNLHALVMANSDVLQTRGVRLLLEQEGFDEADQNLTLRWIVSRKCLALRSPHWTAYIAPTSVAELPRASRHDGPTVARLRARADRSRTRIGTLELDAGDRIISYASKEGEDVLHDDRISQLSNQSLLRVRRASLAQPTGSRLGCDFSILTATGQTSAVFNLGEILKSAMPILLDIDKATRRFLDQLAEAQNTILAVAEQEALEFPE